MAVHNIRLLICSTVFVHYDLSFAHMSIITYVCIQKQTE